VNGLTMKVLRKRAGKDFIINPGRICDILKGTHKTALSKKYSKRFKFEKI